MTYPLVSCIMPTGNRPEFVRRAIDCFLAQTYPNRELVVLDDGYQVDPNVSCHAGFRIRHLWAATDSHKKSIGTKRNILCTEAEGDLIAHWDDDDWSAPERLSEQVDRLLAHPDSYVTGYHALKFYDPTNKRAYQYRNGYSGYACGTSFLYHKSWWRNHQFLDVSRSEDNNFLMTAGDVIGVDAGDRMVATIHDASVTATERREVLAQIGNQPGYSWSHIAVSELPEAYLRNLHG